jgi:hypothetical protein
MFLGAVTLGLINSRVGGELILTASMIVVGLLLSLLAIVPVQAVGIAIAVCMGLFGGMLLITVNTMIQQLTADGFRGRVMAFKELASELFGVTISLIIWQMAAADRYILWVAHAFSALLIVAAVWGLRRYVLRGPLDGGLRNAFWRMLRLYCQAFHRARYHRADRLPRQGGALIVATHTAGVDPLLIQAGQRRLVRWMMASDMMIGALGWFWRTAGIIRVDRDQPDRHSARRAIEALRAGQVVGICP